MKLHDQIDSESIVMRMEREKIPEEYVMWQVTFIKRSKPKESA